MKNFWNEEYKKHSADKENYQCLNLSKALILLWFKINYSKIFQIMIIISDWE